MSVDFNTMPPDSRIWIFQAQKNFSSEERTLVNQLLHEFLNEWKAHGNPLKNAFQIFYNRFIIIAVDESYYSASGCSIDEMMHFIKSLEEKLHQSLTDRSLIAVSDEDEIKNISLSKIAESVRDGVITENCFVYNNAVTFLKDLNHLWKQPASNSWLSKYFNN